MTRYFHILEWIGAVLSATVCLLVSIIFALSQPPIPGSELDFSNLWPLPGLYFLEIILVGMLGLVACAMNRPAGISSWNNIPWIGAGILLAFVALGVATIGLFLIPAFAGLLAQGILQDWRKGDRFSRHAIYFAGSALLQATLIFLLALIIR